MKKRLFLLVFFLFIFLESINGAVTNFKFIATAYIGLKSPQGVTNAEITPAVVRSNESILILADTERAPTNLIVSFNNYLDFFQMTTNSSKDHWELNIITPFKTETSYTANFIAYYTNYTITNTNMAIYSVDNSPPIVLSSTPSDNSTVESNNWDFEIFFQDIGNAGIDLALTLSNSIIIYSGYDDIIYTDDDITNNGVWQISSANSIRFTPANPVSNGFYRVSVLPVDHVGNTNRSMSITNNYIKFAKSDTFVITKVYHRFDLNTQLTPDVPLDICLKGPPGNTAWFEVVGFTNINNISMTEVSNGIYRGKYIIKKNDFIRDGIVRGYLQNAFTTKSLDSKIPVDIGEVISANRGKDIFIVSKDDVDTKLLIPDKALHEDVTVTINNVGYFGDKYAYDFNMRTYKGKQPVEFFKKPLLIYIHYNKNGDQVDRLNIKEESLSSKATLMFYDRVKWLKVGGSFDYKKQLVYGSVKHFSIFALAIDTSNGELVVAPNPFTPNNDNDFDMLHFVGDIDASDPVQAEIAIYSMDGVMHKKLTINDATVNNRTVDLIWDGKDESGNNCAPGLYLYQVVLGNKRYNGTFVLAR